MKISPIGTICKIDNVSVFAMSTYNNYKNKGIRLLCPCKIPRTMQLVVIEKLSQNLALLSPFNNRKLLTIIPWTDLIKF